MRRLIVIGSLFIVMMSILSGCTLDSSSSSPRSSSPVASTVNNSSETYPEVEPTEPILYHDLKMLTSSMGIGTTCNTKTGFYELDLILTMRRTKNSPFVAVPNVSTMMKHAMQLFPMQLEL